MDEKFVEILSFLDDRRDVYYELFSKIRMNYNFENFYDDFTPEKYGVKENEIIKLMYNEDFLNDISNQLIDTQVEYENNIKTLMNDLKNKNKNEYELLITMMYHDQCILLNTCDVLFKDVNLEVLKELMDKIKTKEDLFKIVEEDESILHDMIVFFIDFYEYDYFDKRKKILESKNLNSYFKKIYDYNLIDVLYYTKKYNIADLVLMCKDIDFINGYRFNCDVIDELSGKMSDLYYSDVDNAFELMTSLINKNYKYLLYDVDHKNSDDLKNKLYDIINEFDLENICSKIYNNDLYLNQIIKYFYYDYFLYDSYFKEDVDKYFVSKNTDKFNKKFKVKKFN